MNPNRDDLPNQAEPSATEIDTAIVVFVTASSREEAERIARALVEAGLAACANILSPVTSIYMWKQKMTEEEETMMICKTRRHVFGALVDAVKRLHSYEVPEIIALPIMTGSKEYLDWLTVNTRK
jgi:periplasmic divalent cation tolerance protein